MSRPFISLTSDFGVQSQGVGIMEGVILDISPDANVVHLMHGLPDFNITCGARTLETVINLPVGYHVCVVDPGVGTKRKGLIIKTKRGDYLIGPDNGVLLPAALSLDGIEKVISIENPTYMRQPVSPIFHGRDVFAPAAAHLSLGVPQSNFGPEIEPAQLVEAPYHECAIAGDEIHAEIIHSNKFGSLHLNILHAAWDTFGVKRGEDVVIDFGSKKVTLTLVETFGEVPPQTPVILKDDYGRVEVAINLGNFAKTYEVGIGDVCTIKK